MQAQPFLEVRVRNRRNGRNRRNRSNRRNRRNPTGALLLTNPRNRRNRRNRRKGGVFKKLMGRLKKLNRRNRRNRRNGLALRTNRRNGLALRTNRRNGLALRTNRRNGLALRTNRRGTRKGMRRKTARRAYVRNRRGTRKGMRRRTARRAYMRNPYHKYGRSTRKGGRRKTARRAYMKNRANGTRRGMRRKTARRAYRRNKGDLSLGFMQPINRLVKKLPFGGAVVKYGIPAAAGALSLIPLYYVKEWVGPYVTQYIPAGVTEALSPVSNPITGAAVAMGVSYLPISKNTKVSIGTAALVVGGAMDALDYWSSRNGDEALVDAGGLGDGTAYDLVPADLAGLAMEYGDADGADAYYSGPDFDTYEGQVILAGPRSFRQAFPMAKRAYRRGAGPFSRHAGQRGHRWGWLIKLVGFQNAQQIANLPPQRRLAVIKQLREGAIASIESGLLAAQDSEELVPEAIPSTEGLAVSYGAMVYSGGSY